MARRVCIRPALACSKTERKETTPAEDPRGSEGNRLAPTLHWCRDMLRTSLLWLALFSAGARAQDGGVPAPIPDAGAPTLGFDVVQTPWGPGRKSSGELFRSAAIPVSE